MKKVLTIAGSDCSGGAGIQADLKTMMAHGVYGMSVITALTAQNTTGVFAVEESAPDFVARQLDCVFEDIRPDAVKIGMVSNTEIIEVIAKKLVQYHAEKIVVDPVMVATSGGKLIAGDAVNSLKKNLMPLADIVTPNIPEAECLCGFEITSASDMERAAAKIYEFSKCAVVIKGGHLTETADDLLYHDGVSEWFKAKRIDTDNTHGTGCTLSSAIACELALGYPLNEAYARAKKYVTEALADMLDLGRGNGPLNHCYAIKAEEKA